MARRAAGAARPSLRPRSTGTDRRLCGETRRTSLSMATLIPAISAPPAAAYTKASLACDGASDPAPYVASGRRLEGAGSCWSQQSPGGPGQPLAGSRQQWRCAPLAALVAQGPFARLRKGLKHGPKSGPGQKSPRRGRRKAARGAGNRPGGGSQDPPWLRSRRPRHPSHPRWHRQRGYRCCWGERNRGQTPRLRAAEKHSG